MARSHTGECLLFGAWADCAGAQHEGGTVRKLGHVQEGIRLGWENREGSSAGGLVSTTNASRRRMLLGSSEREWTRRTNDIPSSVDLPSVPSNPAGSRQSNTDNGVTSNLGNRVSGLIVSEGPEGGIKQ